MCVCVVRGVWACGVLCVGERRVVCGCAGVGVRMCAWARAGMCGCGFGCGFSFLFILFFSFWDFCFLDFFVLVHIFEVLVYIF